MDSQDQNCENQQLNLVDLCIPVISTTTIESTISSSTSGKSSSHDDLDDLEEFCEEIETIIKRAEERLVKAYENKTIRKLEKKLHLYVKKLKSLQLEMKTMTDNIGSLKKQNASVKSNLRELKKELRYSKTKEMNHQIKRIPIDNDNHRIDNNENQSNIMSPDFTFRQVIPTQQPPSTPKRNRPNDLSLSRFFDSATSHEPTTTRSRVTFNGSSVKKFKKLKKENNAWPPSVWGPANNGVTLHLFPINNELPLPPLQPKVQTANKIEKIKFPTPTASIANISWRSTQTELAVTAEPTPTDTAASSLTSKLNLLIIDSDELDELD